MIKVAYGARAELTGANGMGRGDDSLAGKLRGEVRFSAPMSAFTSFRVGGPVDYLAFPADMEDLRRILRWCRRQEVHYFILGNGTNLLVRDGGVHGMAISLLRGFTRLEEAELDPGGKLVFAEAGESLGRVVEFASEKGLAGLEFAAGIPGTVGGAIFMNAGAFKGEIKDAIDSVRLMDAAGNVQERGKGELNFSYRSMGLPEGEVILSGRFRLKAGDGQAVRGKGQEILRRRMAKQPLDLPSAGSIFKNPPQGPAGKLIEEAGLKGSRIGDAQISEKHANFIVNRGRARARDILALIELAREKIFKERGILLETEIRVIGED